MNVVLPLVPLKWSSSGTITAELFQGSTSKGTLSAIAEDATRNGRYTGTVADKPAGVAYRVGDPTRFHQYYKPVVSLPEGVARCLA